MFKLLLVSSTLKNTNIIKKLYLKKEVKNV